MNNERGPDSDDSLPLIVSAINAAWCDRYEGPPVIEKKQLITRVQKIAEDRDCWMANAKANQSEYIKLEKQIKELKADKQRLRLGISAHVRACRHASVVDSPGLVDELEEYLSR